MQIDPKLILGAVAIGALWWATRKPALAQARTVAAAPSAAPSDALVTYSAMSAQARAAVGTPVGGSFFAQALAAYAALDLNSQIYMRGDRDNLMALYGAH